MSDRENVRPDEVVAWLAFLAYEGEALGEGELAAALGIDRITARDVILRGGDITARIANARVERVRAEMADAGRLDGLKGQRAYGFGGESIRALFADGKERSAADVATVLDISTDAALRRLMRCDDVTRVRRGVWGPKATDGGDRGPASSK